jgi:hypothetical protein
MLLIINPYSRRRHIKGVQIYPGQASFWCWILLLHVDRFIYELSLKTRMEIVRITAQLIKSVEIRPSWDWKASSDIQNVSCFCRNWISINTFKDPALGVVLIHINSLTPFHFIFLNLILILSSQLHPSLMSCYYYKIRRILGYMALMLYCAPPACFMFDIKNLSAGGYAAVWKLSSCWNTAYVLLCRQEIGVKELIYYYSLHTIWFPYT